MRVARRLVVHILRLPSVSQIARRTDAVSVEAAEERARVRAHEVERSRKAIRQPVLHNRPTQQTDKQTNKQTNKQGSLPAEIGLMVRSGPAGARPRLGADGGQGVGEWAGCRSAQRQHFGLQVGDELFEQRTVCARVRACMRACAICLSCAKPPLALQVAEARHNRRLLVQITPAGPTAATLPTHSLAAKRERTTRSEHLIWHGRPLQHIQHTTSPTQRADLLLLCDRRIARLVEIGRRAVVLFACTRGTQPCGTLRVMQRNGVTVVRGYARAATVCTIDAERLERRQPPDCVRRRR